MFIKRFSILLVLLINCIIISANDYSSNFGFVKQKDIAAYQKYVGKSFMIRNAFGKLETWERTKFYDYKYCIGKIYTINKITVKDIELNGKPNRKITIVASENGSNKKIKFNTYEEHSEKINYWGNIITYPLISYMPIVFVEQLDEFKKNHIGEIIKNDLVKDKYEIVDAFIGEGVGDNYDVAEINVKVKNNRTNDIVECPYSIVNIKPFEYALQGKYTTILKKVEKPEDTSDRYSKSKTIVEDGINKYFYTDSIIDILIFGDSKNFNFILKNVSNHSLKIVWNEAAFVGLDGTSSKIMHTGIKFSERESDQPATTIIRGAKIEDLATPTSNVYYDEGIPIGNIMINNGWKIKSMFPNKFVGDNIGEVKLMLPIQVKDVINEYTFVFDVNYLYDHPELLNLDRQ